MTEETKQDAFAFVKDNMGRTPFHQWLLPELMAVDEKAMSVTVRLKLRPDLCRRPIVPYEVHGGILSALVDITGHAACASKVFHGCSTIDLRIDYLRLGSGEYLTAVGTIVKLGRTISIADVKITDEKGKAVAIGRAAYMTGTAVTV